MCDAMIWFIIEVEDRIDEEDRGVFERNPRSERATID
jgi:hypothetical protein